MHLVHTSYAKKCVVFLPAEEYSVSLESREEHMSKLPANIVNTIANLDADGINMLVRIIKDRREVLQRGARRQLRIGQRVQFDAKGRYYHGPVFGVVVKINPKTIKVMADSGVMWKVSPTFLKTA
jgi:hypothetical protein